MKKEILSNDVLVTVAITKYHKLGGLYYSICATEMSTWVAYKQRNLISQSSGG